MNGLIEKIIKAMKGMGKNRTVPINAINVARKLAQGIATSVSAIKASLGILNFFKTFVPKVWRWKSSADLVSARASSYVFPSPTTAPSIPNGYPTYPSSSLEMTIFIDKCIFISPSIRKITQGLDNVKLNFREENRTVPINALSNQRSAISKNIANERATI